MKAVKKDQELNRSEIVLHEILALKRLKELQNEEKRRKRRAHWRELWLLLWALPLALIRVPRPEREIAPDERPQPLHEREARNLLIPRVL